MRTSRGWVRVISGLRRRTHERSVPDRLAAVARIEEIGGPMPVTENAVLTTELRLDVQEFYARYAECLDGGRLQQWPEFFVDSCTYRVTTRRNLRLGPEGHLVSLSTRSTLRDRIVAIGQSGLRAAHAAAHHLEFPRPGRLRRGIARAGELPGPAHFPRETHRAFRLGLLRRPHRDRRQPPHLQGKTVRARFGDPARIAALPDLTAQGEPGG